MLDKPAVAPGAGSPVTVTSWNESMFGLHQLIDFYLFGRHRLQTVQLLPLGCSISEAVKLFGGPIETERSEETPEITQYTFAVGPYHQAVALEWQQIIRSITYWSAKADPAKDLKYVLDCYKDDSRWRVMEEGYWYQREDGKVRLWCSAIPAIGVAYVEFLAVKAEYETANSLKRLAALPDVTWAPDEAVFELQRQFVEEQKLGLMEFASRSDRIAASPNGRYVFIVRDHQAYDVEGGFTELNVPPAEKSGFSIQVINRFAWTVDGSVWSKIVLPRNANVDYIGFEGSQCRLRIRNEATNRVLTFQGSAESIGSLGAISLGPHDDKDIWRALEETSERHGESK